MEIPLVLSNLDSTEVKSWHNRHNKPGGRRSPPLTKFVGLDPRLESDFKTVGVADVANLESR
jgi:hypothetical protein